MPQLTEPGNLPPAPFTQFLNTTLRQTIRATIAGDQFGCASPTCSATNRCPSPRYRWRCRPAGQAGVNGIQAGSSRPVTFAGQSSVVVPAGGQMLSDPFSMKTPESS